MSNEAVVASETPNQLIALALEKQADPEVIKKMMDLQERWEAGQARKAYVKAMTSFKQEAPAVLKKGDKVDFTSSRGRTTYNYANLGSIVQEITSLLGKHDLSASWTTAQEGSNVTVTCHITHIAGHRESVVLTGPADDSGNKNRIQAVGSTVTYLQRYTLLAALGLATGEDDDGRQGISTKNEIKAPQSKSESSKTQPQEEKDNSGFAGTLVYSGTLVEVSIKSGKKGTKTWTLYGVKVGNLWFNTFDKTIAETAKEAEGRQVEVEYVQTDKSKDLKGITLLTEDTIDCPEDPMNCDRSSFVDDQVICADTQLDCPYKAKE